MNEAHSGFKTQTSGSRVEENGHGNVRGVGFNANPACTGQTGLGKSTLINTIFASHLIDSKGRFAADEPVRQTTEIQAVSHGACTSRYCTRYDADDAIPIPFAQSLLKTVSS